MLFTAENKVTLNINLLPHPCFTPNDSIRVLRSLNHQIQTREDLSNMLVKHI